jgi:hypothetical protein
LFVTPVSSRKKPTENYLAVFIIVFSV